MLLMSVAANVALPMAWPAMALADDEGGEDGSGGSDTDSSGAGGTSGSGDPGAGSGTGSGDADTGMGTGENGGPQASATDSHEDHVFAWRARKRGELRSLRDILQHAKRKHDGQVLDVRLRREGKRTWYEIQILDKNDHVRKLRLPASRKLQNFTSGKH